MKDRFRYGLFFCLLLITAVLIAGCSDQQVTTATPVSTTAPLAKYVAGDIVGKSASSSDTVLSLIVNYDAATDQYERAWIYKNDDGSWGHRIDTKTDKTPRSVIEKAYPVLVTHVTVTSIPVVTPTVPTMTPITYSSGHPMITSISPTSGATGSSPSVTITGTNFQTGATVKLVQPGTATATASGVSVSSTSISCVFTLSSFDKGTADVIVINPDGQSTSLPNGFTIGNAPPSISSVTPSSLAQGSGPTAMTINGNNFKDGVKIYLTSGSTEIVCLNSFFSDSTKLMCDMSIPFSAATGDWTLNVLNIEDLQKGSWGTAFKITNATAT